VDCLEGFRVSGRCSGIGEEDEGGMSEPGLWAFSAALVDVVFDR
jgi:hypothetical protein